MAKQDVVDQIKHLCFKVDNLNYYAIFWWLEMFDFERIETTTTNGDSDEDDNLGGEIKGTLLIYVLG